MYETDFSRKSLPVSFQLHQEKTKTQSTKDKK